MRYLSDFKRAAVPGSRWMCINRTCFAAALVGRQVTIRAGVPGAGGQVLHVQHAEGGFLDGKVERPARWATGYPLVAVHLTETGLLPDRPHLGMADRAGHPITVDDLVNEYTSGRIGPEPAGQLVGTFRVVAVSEPEGVLFTDRYADRGLVEAVAFPADVERVDQAATTKAQVQIVSNGVTAPLVRITKTEARQRWDANDYVAVTNDRYDDGHPGFAMLPSAMLKDFPTFDAMVAASIDRRRPSALHFSKPDPTRLDGNAVALEAKRVVRQFQRYTSEQRADRAASHRLGHRQKTALGEHFYTHPGLPGVAFDSRKRAAETAHHKLGQQPTPGVRVVSGPHEPSPTVRHCDVGGEALPGDARWWLVTAPDRGWEAHHGASCATHIGKADAAPCLSG